jgi:hypothetical protein
MKFKPCNGDCTDEGIYCRGCGRTHQEIEAMRRPVEELAALATRMQYENIEDFVTAVAGSVKYKLGMGH